MPNAKYSALIHHIPKAIDYGAEVLSDSMVIKILTDKNGERASGVEFVHDGQTSGGANPTETVMAISARTADYIINLKYKGAPSRKAVHERVPAAR